MSSAATAPIAETASPDVSPSGIGELAARLRLSTTRLSRRLRRETEFDLSPTASSAVAAINVHGPLTLGALAEHERVSPPTITKIVATLEQRGLVERIVDPTDRRVCRVECTSEGVALIERSRDRKNAWLAARLDALGPEARARLSGAMDVLEELATGGPT